MNKPFLTYKEENEALRQEMEEYVTKQGEMLRSAYCENEALAAKFVEAERMWKTLACENAYLVEKLNTLRYALQELVNACSENKCGLRIADEALAASTFLCRKCGGEMRPGAATEQTWRAGVPDLGGDEIRTMNPGGPGRIVECLKCSKCGWSVTK